MTQPCLLAGKWPAKKYLVWLIALLVTAHLSLPVVAQSIRVLSTKDGLPQSFVSGLVQDRDGFVWIGTRSGLARYDGMQYKIFLHNAHDSSSIASNIIIWINKDVHNNLWVEYESGDIDRINPVTEQIEHFISGDEKKILFVRRGWVADHSGIFWGIRKGAGLNSFDQQKKEIHSYTRASADLPSDTLRGILEDSKGRMVILGQTVISYFDKSSAKFLHTIIPYDQDYNNYFNSDEEVVDLHERKNGELMWGDRKRLYFFNPVNKTFRIVPLLSTRDVGIRWIRTGPDSTEYLESNGDIFRYDDFNGLSKLGSAGLARVNDARSFLADRSGLLWIGTNAAGIHQLDLVTPFFKSFAYTYGFMQDLLKQEMGVSLIDMFSWKPEDEKFSASSYHFRSRYDKEGLLWMGLKATVCYYDFKLKKVVKLPPVPMPDLESEHGIAIKGITLTGRGEPAVAGYSGCIYQFDATTRKWQAVIDPLVMQNKYGASLRLQDIIADAGRFWMTSANDGLFYLDRQTKEIKQLKAGTHAGSLPTNQLLGILEDLQQPGVLWIGSYQGLIRFNKKTLDCKVFGLEEGLPDNTVYSILPDNSGNLWLSTNKGLCRFNRATHEMRVFRVAYGLPGDEFNRFHHIELPDGRLAFGGTEGWTIFDPLSIKNDEFEPGVSLTSLKVNNVIVNPGNDSLILPAPLNALQKLVLPFSDNTIAIAFAGLQFNQPQDILYRYQLIGYDDDWVNAGHSSTATYTKIPPGHYTLMVNASNTSGKWSHHVKTLPITVQPPWWRTWWAYICYGILLFGLVWSYINFRLKRELYKQELSLKEKETSQLKEVDRMKTRFFSNITHEFRTPLSLILGPAEQLKQRHPDDSQQQKLGDIIMKNASQLLLLINQLMDLAKLESRAVAPVMRIGNPEETIESVIESFENEAQAKKIHIINNTKEFVKDYWFSAEVIERVVYNLIANALKFTPEQGEIALTLSEQPNGIKLTVADTGLGIAPDKLPHIFDRFYQAHTDEGSDENLNPGKKGTGIGLALVKELVELQGGKITVQSKVKSANEKHSGTIFSIILPLRIADSDEMPETTENDAIQPDDRSGETDGRPQIVLAEDNPELAEFIKGCLQEEYTVHHFINGAIALENAHRLMPDLIISDVLMPVMDGFTFTTRIKEDIRTSHIPVILLTAKASQESRIEGLSQGANDYLTKPFHPTELLLRIRNLLDQQRRLREHVRHELLPGNAVTSHETISKVHTPKDPFLTRVNELIDLHLDDPLFGVEELVSKLDMSRTSLHRKIKALSGMSTGELVRNYRLKRAAAFLLQGHNSTDTAYLSGFGSPAYFTKCFREVYGVTPGDYIRQNSKAI